ncbi:Y-family DNA polymerase [Flavobacterium sp.]|uniref:Y-family DNA polymerase n=1 Tax=Flavobacterium sp. TaxID=239 RepID=UPI00286DBFB1|nr:Y-family DNA polymerase [Flavobacterium sp.]
MYAIVDCNNFYASCERVFHPEFIGKPIVVLSNNDGCVIARSEEVKELGIAMGNPEFKIRDDLKRLNVKVFSSNYALYGDLSNRVMIILKQFSPNVEIYSIDEAFINFEGMSVGDYQYCGFQMKERLQKWLGLPVSIGFAPTKVLSKIANKIAKKFPDRTKSVYIIDSEEKRIKALKWTKIQDVWGIGFRLSKKLIARNVMTAFDFVQPEQENWIKREMGVVGLRLKNELEGKSVLEFDEPRVSKKSIAITRSFESKLSSFDDLKERISTFATICAEKLRKQNTCCYTVIVFIKKDKYQNSSQRYYYSMMETLPFASNSNITISNLAIKMMKQMYEPNQKYQKGGVIVTQIIPQDAKQFHLFEEENPKHQKLMEVMDYLHKKMGQRKIRLGNQDLQRTWKMRQNHLSKNFTTDINDIIEVQCK